MLVTQQLEIGTLGRIIMPVLHARNTMCLKLSEVVRERTAVAACLLQNDPATPHRRGQVSLVTRTCECLPGVRLPLTTRHSCSPLHCRPMGGPHPGELGHR